MIRVERTDQPGYNTYGAEAAAQNETGVSLMARTCNQKKAQAEGASEGERHDTSDSASLPSASRGQVLADSTAQWTLQQLTPWGSEDAESVSKAVMKDLLTEMAPRDPLERMLVAQLAYTHERIGRLSRFAVGYRRLKDAMAAHEGCERAMNTFRKGMVALKEYRSKPRETPLVAVQQVNNAAGGNTRIEAIPVDNRAEAVPLENKKKEKT